MKPWLELDAVVAGYDRPVVGPVSLTLAPGEVLGLAGPNGVGKSTLMAAILGEAMLFQGRLARAQDVLVAHLPQRLIRPHGIALTGREWLRCMGARARPYPEQLTVILDQRIDRLSGGEYQLLNLWGILAIGAGIVLLDEPTNNLDPLHMQLTAALIGSAGDQRALLVISHDQAFLKQVCTRIMRLEA
ncbi:MAG: ATP-binding cassette domain-containing protein [Thiobacillaceae bacterium]